MKAIIMAGGEGRRLRSVSGESPKPMVPFLGKPMMEHIILLLKAQGFTEICAALRYKAEDIESCFGDGSRLGVRLTYRREGEALGTAGAVKNCADFIGDEDFLVISGDAACDFELSELYRRHKASGAAASLALYRDSEPLSYGLAVTDSGSMIRAFVEKPSWERVVTDLVNTGIYVLSPKILPLIPDGRSFDFGKELFPLLLDRGEKLLGVELSGYWCDVGTPLSYYKCCVDALEGRLRIDIPESFRHSPAQNAKPQPDDSALILDCDCRDRARMMSALSTAMLDMGADYSDGIRLGRLHIAPLSGRSALRVSVGGEDAEFARSLAFSVKELIEAIDL